MTAPLLLGTSDGVCIKVSQTGRQVNRFGDSYRRLHKSVTPAKERHPVPRYGACIKLVGSPIWSAGILPASVRLLIHLPNWYSLHRRKPVSRGVWVVPGIWREPGLIGCAFAWLSRAGSGLSLFLLDVAQSGVKAQTRLQAFAEAPELGAQRIESGFDPVEPGIGPVALPDQHDDRQKDRNYDRRHCDYALYAHNRHPRSRRDSRLSRRLLNSSLISTLNASNLASILSNLASTLLPCHINTMVARKIAITIADTAAMLSMPTTFTTLGPARECDSTSRKTRQVQPIAQRRYSSIVSRACHGR